VRRSVPGVRAILMGEGSSARTLTLRGHRTRWLTNPPQCGSVLWLGADVNTSPRYRMIDRLVHHAEVVRLGGDGYRPKDRDLGRVLLTTEPDRLPRAGGHLSAVVDTTDFRRSETVRGTRSGTTPRIGIFGLWQSAPGPVDW
jgi:hypothetical protein